jgi:hypothetical protein
LKRPLPGSDHFILTSPNNWVRTQWSIKAILAKKLKKIFFTKMLQFNSAHKINLLGMFYKILEQFLSDCSRILVFPERRQSQNAGIVKFYDVN